MEENLKSHVFTSIEINATCEQVWSVLTDWNKLPEWSSSFQGIEGEMSLGAVSKALFKNPLGKIMDFEHEIIAYEEGKKFGWSGNALLGLKDHHIYSIESLPNGKTLFKQEDGLNGSGVSGFLGKIAELGIESSFKKFNEELKARVEFLYPNV